jgi:hypothetical protein
MIVGAGTLVRVLRGCGEIIIIVRVDHHHHHHHRRRRRQQQQQHRDGDDDDDHHGATNGPDLGVFPDGPADLPDIHRLKGMHLARPRGRQSPELSVSDFGDRQRAIGDSATSASKMCHSLNIA